jgi:ribonuclease P protein subunit RPR2|tara:strand:- start:668 stop:976 length:309 start_codon:yes stop_codon:yes gene_type:complete
MAKKYKNKAKEKKIAREKIGDMFKQAKDVFKKDSGLSHNLIRKARNLAMKHKIRLPSNLKRRFCSHCYKYLVPSVNCRVRVQRGKVVYYCLNCKKFTRLPYK